MNYLDRASDASGLPAGARVRVALDVLALSARLALSERNMSSRRVTVSEVRVDGRGVGSVPRASAPNLLTTLLWEILAGKASETDETPWSDPATDLHDDVLAVLSSLSVRPAESANDLLKRFSAAAEPSASPRQAVLEAFGPVSSSGEAPLPPRQSATGPQSQRRNNDNTAARAPLKTPVVPARDQSMATIPAPPMTVQALLELTAKAGPANAATRSADPATPKAPPAKIGALKAPRPFAAPVVSADAKASFPKAPLVPRLPVRAPIAPPKVEAPFKSATPAMKLGFAKPTVAKASAPRASVSVATLPREEPESPAETSSASMAPVVQHRESASPVATIVPLVHVVAPVFEASDAPASQVVSAALWAPPSLPPDIDPRDVALGESAISSTSPTAISVADQIGPTVSAEAARAAKPFESISTDHFTQDSTFTDAEIPIAPAPRRRRGWLISGVTLGASVLLLVWAARLPRGQEMMQSFNKPDPAKADHKPAARPTETSVATSPDPVSSPVDARRAQTSPVPAASSARPAVKTAVAPPPRAPRQAARPRSDAAADNAVPTPTHDGGSDEKAAPTSNPPSSAALPPATLPTAGPVNPAPAEKNSSVSSTPDL